MTKFEKLKYVVENQLNNLNSNNQPPKSHMKRSMHLVKESDTEQLESDLEYNRAKRMHVG